MVIPVCLNPDWLPPTPSIPVGFHIISPHSNCSACTWLCPLVCQRSQRWGLSWHNATLNLVPAPDNYILNMFLAVGSQKLGSPFLVPFIHLLFHPPIHSSTHPPTHCAHIYSPTCSVHFPSLIHPAPTMYTALRRFKEGPWGSCLYSSGKEDENISFKKISFYQ